jgi:ribosomal protein L6P/L9E
MKSFLPFSLQKSVLQKSLVVVGDLGIFSFYFHGLDLSFFTSGIFLRTYSSCSQLLSLLTKLQNSLTGGHFVELSLVGLGFRVIKLSNFLLLKLGYSHYIKLPIPVSLHVLGYKKRIIVFGINLNEVNCFVEQLVSFRAPDVYKNKGVQLSGKTFRIKTGKQK